MWSNNKNTSTDSHKIFSNISENDVPVFLYVDQNNGYGVFQNLNKLGNICINT